MALERFSVIPASYVYLLRGRQVLLQQRRNTGYMDGMWVAAAAGHIEIGETAAAAAVRESVEEIGVVLEPTDLRPATVMQRTDSTDVQLEQRVDWFFTARRWQGEPTICEPQKCAALQWFGLDDLPPAIPAYERVVLDGIARDDLSILTSFGFPELESGRSLRA